MREGVRPNKVILAVSEAIEARFDRSELTMTFPTARSLEARRTEAYNGFLELIARAKSHRHLREDFTDRDMPILLMANAGVIAATQDAAPDTWQHLVGHMLRSYATPDAPLPPLADAPAAGALYRAMVRLARPDHAPSAAEPIV